MWGNLFGPLIRSSASSTSVQTDMSCGSPERRLLGLGSQLTEPVEGGVVSHKLGLCDTG